MWRKTIVAAIAAFPIICVSGFAQDSNQDDDFICLTQDHSVRSGRSYYQILFADDVKWLYDKGAVPGSTPNNIKIGVVFLDGTEEQKKQVRELAQTWITEAKAGIEWVFDPFDPTNPAVNQIRITFRGKDGPWDRGNWSAVGREALDIPKAQPTMSFATENGKAPGQRAILHEFGHALGLEHEHQHPWRTFDLEPKKAVIVKDHVNTAWCSKKDPLDPKKTVFMTQQECEKKVEEQIIKTKLVAQLCPGSTAYDPASVMHYPIPAAWTVQGKPIGGADTLSPGDTKCIGATYPRKGVTSVGTQPPPEVREEPYCRVDVVKRPLFIRTRPYKSKETIVHDRYNLDRDAEIYVTRLSAAHPAAANWGHTSRFCTKNRHRPDFWDHLVRPGYVSFRDLKCSQDPPARCGPFRAR